MAGRRLLGHKSNHDDAEPEDGKRRHLVPDRELALFLLLVVVAGSRGRDAQAMLRGAHSHFSLGWRRAAPGAAASPCCRTPRLLWIAQWSLFTSFFYARLAGKEKGNPAV